MKEEARTPGAQRPEFARELLPINMMRRRRRHRSLDIRLRPCSKKMPDEAHHQPQKQDNHGEGSERVPLERVSLVLLHARVRRRPVARQAVGRLRVLLDDERLQRQAGLEQDLMNPPRKIGYLKMGYFSETLWSGASSVTISPLALRTATQ